PRSATPAQSRTSEAALSFQRIRDLFHLRLQPNERARPNHFEMRSFREEYGCQQVLLRSEGIVRNHRQSKTGLPSPTLLPTLPKSWKNCRRRRNRFNIDVMRAADRLEVASTTGRSESCSRRVPAPGCAPTGS